MDAIRFTAFPPPINYEADDLFLVEVTPELAGWLIVRNYDGNRKLRQSKVADYASDMKAGKFPAIKSQPIVFTSDGKLIDGQHRLKAVIEAKVTVPMWVMTGQPMSDFEYLDNGYVRAADMYINQRIKNKNTLLAVARAIMHVESSKNLRQSVHGGYAVATRNQLVEYVNEHEASLSSLASAAMAMRHALGGCGQPSVYGLFLYACSVARGQEAALAAYYAVTAPDDVEHFKFAKQFVQKYATNTDKPTKEWAFGMLARFSDALQNGNYPTTYTRQSDALAKMQKEFDESVDKNGLPDLKEVWPA